MALIAEQLRSEVADVRHFDVLRLELRLGQAGHDRMPHHVGNLHAVARPVIGEVRLVAAEQVDPCRHVASPASARKRALARTYSSSSRCTMAATGSIARITCSP